MSPEAGTSDAFLADEAATLALGHRFAQQLPPAARPLVMYLDGELGAGKTTFVRGLLQGLGHRGPVRSPTYGLISEYELAGGRALHLDLYRLHDPEELHNLGLGDYLPGSRLWLIEWPDRAGEQGLPPADVTLRLDPETGGRRANWRAFSALGRHWLAPASADRA